MPGRVVIFGWAESVHVQKWATGLSEQGWQIRVISQAGGPVPGVETYNLGQYGRLSYLRHASKAAKLAREFKPDLIHVHYAGGFSLWGERCNFAPLLVSVWGSDIVGLSAYSIQKYLIRRVLKRAAWVSATSYFLRDTCVRLLPEVENRIAVIPFGVTPPASVPPMPQPPFRLCYIKKHSTIYGPDVLLYSLAAVCKRIPDIRLTMAGTGELTSRLKRLADKLGLSANVDFVGFVPHERIYSLLQAHHAMVMPSRAESFGVAVLEAAVCARPSIASRVGGVPEVLHDGETGLLVQPGDPVALEDAIMRLAGDFVTCQRMGQAARSFVSDKYCWKNSLGLMTALYEKLMNGTRTNPSF